MNVHKVGSVVGDAMIQVGKSLLALVHFTYLQNIFQVKKILRKAYHQYLHKLLSLECF